MTMKKGDPIRFGWDSGEPDQGLDMDENVIRGVLVSFPQMPGWEFRLDLTPDRITRLDVRADEGVTSRSLRELPLATIGRDARGWAAGQLAMSAAWEAGVSMSPDLAQEVVQQVQSFRKRPGRAKRGDRYYASAAAEYVELVATSATPLKALAERNRYSSSQTRNILSEARRRGFLTQAPAGRAGGELTPLARELLQADA